MDLYPNLQASSRSGYMVVMLWPMHGGDSISSTTENPRVHDLSEHNCKGKHESINGPFGLFMTKALARKWPEQQDSLGPE